MAKNGARAQKLSIECCCCSQSVVSANVSALPMQVVAMNARFGTMLSIIGACWGATDALMPAQNAKPSCSIQRDEIAPIRGDFAIFVARAKTPHTRRFRSGAKNDFLTDFE